VLRITEISEATRWKPGQSDNPNARPVGTRQAFSTGFLRDFAEVWTQHGAVIKTARAMFFAVYARLISSDVKLTVGQI
jgi:hypothetical protein